jgi:hypothetical protein
MKRKKKEAPTANGRSTASDGKRSNTRSGKAQVTLAAIEKELPKLEDELSALGKTVLQKALQYGELLTIAKGLLKHGEWLPWLKGHVRFSQTAVWHYMKLWERRDDPELVKLFGTNNLMDVTEAYAVLGLPWGTGKLPRATKKLRTVEEVEAETVPLAADDTYTLSLTEEGIRYFIEVITAQTAGPEDWEVWQILVREVQRRLKELEGSDA